MSRHMKINGLLVLLVAALAVLPLVFGLGDHKEEPFAGADAEAETAITEIAPDYEPWFSPLYEPPSGEVESALFALQAAIGTGVLAYYFGLRRGRRQGEVRVAAATGRPGADGGGPAGADGAATTATASGAGSPSGAAPASGGGVPSGAAAGTGADAADGDAADSGGAASRSRG
ncbi:energy-coupling factor ABC transporter substrate-binding protein [Streptomyces sp. DSM 116494]|uniref:energy-coupling factor ABC transporter substrate-binding protein n=1 Tax=Streptomyces TaxID=1883 RepID=UPI00365D7615